VSKLGFSPLFAFVLPNLQFGRTGNSAGRGASFVKKIFSVVGRWRKNALFSALASPIGCVASIF
jgi:hypothetical protein